MLKLLKYEMIQSYRQYFLTLGIFLILCVLAPLLPDFISQVLSSLMIFAMLGISIAVLVNVITNFNRSMYKRPGYLTLTLPVSTEKLVGAKFIGSLIWVFVSSIVLSLGILIIVFLIGNVPLNTLFDLFGELLKALGNNFGLVVINLIDSIAMVSSMILSFYAIITLTKTQYFLTLGIFLILCVLAPLLPDFISQVLSSLMIFAMLGISIAVLVNVITNFNRSMYKRPGYLTLTLPVSTEKLVGAKFIGSLIWVFVSSIVLSLGILIIVFLIGNVPLNTLFDLFGELLKALGNNFGLVVINLIDSIAMVSSMILSFYAIITLTKTKYIPKHKTVIGIIVYVALLILGSSLLMWQPIESFVMSLDSTASVWFSIVLNLVLATAFYFFTVYLIDHKIEVE